jgi:eukaryotic-like serine/threonine-protein kinase
VSNGNIANSEGTALEGPRAVLWPRVGEVITSGSTGNTYTMGEMIGEGNFGLVFACRDIWENDLAAKVLKPLQTYEAVQAAAMRELATLLRLRNPNITFIHDAFELKHTFYIITERCYCPLTNLFGLSNFNGQTWILPIARCLLQAVHYLHINQVVHQDIHGGNVFAAFARNEMIPSQPGALHFKLGDLGVAKLFSEVGAANTRAEWMLPPEVLDPSEYGPIDHRLDLYHVGLLFLQFAYSSEMTFTREEILGGKPRTMALDLPPPFNFALEKTLRRHTPYRTATAMELWRDLHAIEPIDLPEQESEYPDQAEIAPSTPAV